MKTPHSGDAPVTGAADDDSVAASAIATLAPAVSAPATVIGFPATGRQGDDPKPSGGVPAHPAATGAVTGTRKRRRRQRRRTEAPAATGP